MSEDIPDGILSPDGKHRWTASGWQPVESVAAPDPPVPPPPPVDSPASAPSRPPGRKRLLLLAGVGVLAAGAIAATLTIVLSGSSKAAPTLRATLTLTGGGGYTTYDPCYGTNNGLADNSDLTASTQVEVLDASGTVDGTTELGPGLYSADNKVLDAESGGYGPYSSCTFTFTAKLDHASPHYRLLIGQRPPFNFDDPSALDLTLGFAHP